MRQMKKASHLDYVPSNSKFTNYLRKSHAQEFHTFAFVWHERGKVLCCYAILLTTISKDRGFSFERNCVLRAVSNRTPTLK